MNDSLGADPTEILNARLQLPVADALDDIGYSDRERESPLKPSREGLPASFRMRHDRHYVEELMSTPPRPEATAYASNPRPSVPAAGVPPLVNDRRTAPETASPSAAGLELIASRLESVVAHGAIARAHATAIDFVSRAVDAELQRVSRFARAVAVNARQAEPVRRPVTAGEIATAVRSACTRPARLLGINLVITTDDAGFSFAGDRALIVQGIAGTIDAVLDLAAPTAAEDSVDEGARISVSLQGVRVRPALIAEIECPTLTWRAAPDRLFENREHDFAGAPAAGILLASAAHVVRLLGGRVEAQMQGTARLRYVFPQDTPRVTTAS